MLNAKVEEEDMKPVCSLLALVLTMQLLTAASDDSDVPMNITAVLGHSVTFKCPSTHGKSVKGLYIQRMKNDKEEVFINGFYKGRHVQVNPEYQDRTKVNEMELSMEMRNISISDEGLYKCYVFYNKLKVPKISEILLAVTGMRQDTSGFRIEEPTHIQFMSVYLNQIDRNSEPEFKVQFKEIQQNKRNFKKTIQK